MSGKFSVPAWFGTLLLASVVHGQGIALTGVGPVSRSIAGVATATPLDAAGAIHWNPATVTALPQSELIVGLELLLADEQLSSQYSANTFGPGLPPVDVQGTTRGEPGVMPIPNAACVWLPDDSCFAYGIGILSVAGFGTNYPSSLTNPILMPAPPVGLGLGHIDSRAEIMQIVPTLGCQVTESLHVGFSPTITMARVAVVPGLLAPPDDANGDTMYNYADATGTRYHWGGGFQVGVYYTTASCWNFGAAVKSPQWLEPLRFHARDELGTPRVLEMEFDYPLITSLGTSYTGLAGWIFGADVRYFNYADTDGFGTGGFRPDGAVAGLGWEDVWSFQVGAQHQLTETVTARMGYSFNENPITSDTNSFNVASPLITQHALYGGFTKWLQQNFAVHLAGVIGFENSVTGPLVSVAGPVPGTSITNTVAAYAVDAGITVRF